MLSPIGDFTARVLAHHGALVEHDEHGIVAVMPPALAAALEVPEYQRLTFGPRTATPGGLPVDYDSPLLDRFTRLVDELGRAAFVPARMFPLKKINPEKLITDAITLTNGIIRDYRAEPGQARYIGFFIEHELLADERTSGMTELWVNVTTRSAPRLAGLAETLLTGQDDGTADGSAHGAVPDDVSGTVADAWTLAAALAKPAVEHRLQDTIESLRRRRERDFVRLHEYYEAIDGDIRRRAHRALVKGDHVTAEAEVARLNATARAYQARVADLVDRYRARVRLRPLGAVVCTLPVHQVTVRVHRRSASRTVAVTWNPIDRAVEPPCCEACGVGTSTIALCDDRVHLLCSACHSGCETCGRPYCRACHARCPRRHG